MIDRAYRDEYLTRDNRCLKESPPMEPFIHRLLPSILMALSLLLMSCGSSTDDSDLSGVYDQKNMLRLSEDPKHLDMYRLEVCLVDDNSEGSVTPHEPSCVGAIRSQNGENILLSKALIQSIELSHDDLETLKQTHSEYQNYIASLKSAPKLNGLYTIGGGVLTGGAAGIGYYKLVAEPDIKKLDELRGHLQKASKELTFATAVPSDVLKELPLTEADNIHQVQQLTHKTLQHYLSVDSTDQARHVRKMIELALETSVSTGNASTLASPKWLAGRDHIYSKQFINFVSQVQPEFDSAQKVHYALQTPQFYQPKIARIYREWIAKGHAPEQIIDEVFFEPLMKFAQMESMMHHAAKDIGPSHLTPSWIRHLTKIHYPSRLDTFAKSLSKGETHVLMMAREFFIKNGQSSIAQLSLDWADKYDQLIQAFPNFKLKQTALNLSDDLADGIADLRLIKNPPNHRLLNTTEKEALSSVNSLFLLNNRLTLLRTLESKHQKLTRELNAKNIRLIAKNMIAAVVLIAAISAGISAILTWSEQDSNVNYSAAQIIIQKYNDLELALHKGLTTSEQSRVNSAPEMLKALSVWISVLHAEKVSSLPHSICIPQRTGFTNPSFKVSCQHLSDAI